MRQKDTTHSSSADDSFLNVENGRRGRAPDCSSIEDILQGLLVRVSCRTARYLPEPLSVNMMVESRKYPLKHRHGFLLIDLGDNRFLPGLDGRRIHCHSVPFGNHFHPLWALEKEMIGYVICRT